MILATFFLLALVSVGCVSAADDVQADANMAIDDSINDEISVIENDNEGVSDPITEEQLGENEPGTFTDLDNKIQNAGSNLVELDRDYIFNDAIDNPERYSKINGIYLKPNIIIDGKGHTIDGNNQAKIFVIQDVFNVTIKNLIFKNAFANKTYYGGAALEIQNAPAHVINCTFINNFANNTIGGAIFDYGHSPIENCTFINNSASQGGAIYGNPDINNCTFINNTAGSGGALLLTRMCYLNNSAFYNNTATERNGGAISGAAYKFENSIFEGNKAASNGGAMFLTDNWYTLEVNNCTFKNNVANLDGNQEYYCGGGAISMSDNKGLVTNSKFINNTGNNGGALLSQTLVTVKNTTFEDNNGKSGGAIYMGTGAVTGCTFTNNNATLTGGAIHGGSWNFTLSSSTFENNNAADGGAMYITKGNISNSQFFNNSATAKGGAAFLNNSDVYNCQFTFNNASDGGAVYMGNTTVNESGFYNNTAVNGAALYATEGAVYNSKFVDNVAEETGGAISVVTSLDITNADFSGNTANDVPNDYDSENPEASIKITRDTVITAKAASYVINYGGYYSATLKDNKGNPLSDKKVTFVLNGRTIGTVRTNASGVAKIKLTASILRVAKYGTKNMVIKYAGDSLYGAFSKTVKVTIRKESTKIVASAKTFRRSLKTKNYNVVLRNSKNRVLKKTIVYLRVNGRTFRATTSTRGIATFKITNLKKRGKFLAIMTYRGNAYYLKSTRRVYLTIK